MKRTTNSQNTPKVQLNFWINKVLLLLNYCLIALYNHSPKPPNNSLLRGFGLCLCYCLLSFALAPALSAQGFYTNFGQNRVQYKDNIWSYYESPDFVTYYYQGGQELAYFCTIIAEASLNDIESKLEFKNTDKVEIMVYQDISDLKQTNIGTGQEVNNTGGITKILGNKIFVYFNGDHRHLARQVRQGIARVSIERMVFGTNIQEMIQNAVTLNLPEWFTSGLAAYVGEEWNTQLDNQLRNAIAHNRLKEFAKLNGEEATFAGHALWHYLAQQHGAATIPNILYLTRINRHAESGFYFVLGNNIKTTIQNFNNYYTQQANSYKLSLDSLSNGAENDTLSKNAKRIWRSKTENFLRRLAADQVHVSPNGQYVALTTNDFGQHKVILLDTQTDKKYTLLRTGFKSYRLPYQDNYPLLAWDKNGEKLAIVYEERDAIKLLFYTPTDQKKEFADDLTKFQQVTGITFTNDSRKMVLSAMQNGQLDLFSYYIPNTKVTRLTNDFFDEREPRYIETQQRSGILFSSNRLNDTLRSQRFDTIMPRNFYDLYFYDLGKATAEPDNIDGRVLIRMSNTPFADELQATQFDSTYIAFLSDENGINNRYMGYFDSVYVRTDHYVYYKDSMVLNPRYDIKPFQQRGLIDSLVNKDIYKTIGRSFPISDLSNGLVESDIALQSKQMYSLRYVNNYYELTAEPLPEQPLNAKTNPSPTLYRRQMERSSQIFTVIPTIAANPNSTAPTLPQAPNTKPTNEQVLPNNQQNGDTNNTKTNITPNITTADTTAQTNNNTNITNKENYYLQTIFDNEYANNKAFPGGMAAAKSASLISNTPTSSTDNQSKVAASTSLYGNSSAFLSDRDRIFKRSRIRNHFVRFMTDNVVSQLDNSIMFTPYQLFTGGAGGFNMPNLNGLIKVGITDLMEDYRITGGFRIPLGLNGTEYFVEYQNYRRRLDKKLLYYRRVDEGIYYTNLIQGTLSYPFDINRSMRFYGSYRQDRIVIPASDTATLNIPDQHISWLMAKGEYVYDNTIDIALNILNGTRYKFFAEIHKPFYAQIGERGIDFDFKYGYVGVVGADIRHYQRVHRQIIWANRLATSMSFGSNKIIYYLGGVENWLQFDTNKLFDSNTPISQDENYVYQALATNMRGFKQNARNGTSYMVLNSELRVPVFAALSSTQLRSEMLKNFQLLAFVDVGTAWKGLSPFDDDNRYNIVTIPNPPAGPVVVTARYFKNPLVAGYGFGARTKLLGYFVRADVAWGVDGKIVSDPRWYFSMGLDF